MESWEKPRNKEGKGEKGRKNADKDSLFVCIVGQ